VSEHSCKRSGGTRMAKAIHAIHWIAGDQHQGVLQGFGNGFFGVHVHELPGLLECAGASPPIESAEDIVMEGVVGETRRLTTATTDGRQHERALTGDSKIRDLKWAGNDQTGTATVD
jgi:hypothetical protein